MPGYWWHCEGCGKDFAFSKACGRTSIAAFIHDDLVTSNWDQALLLRPCPDCAQTSLRIQYEFPRKDRELVTVYRIVGLGPGADYLPMMWETGPASEPDVRWYDFKYLGGRNVRGLSKPAVLQQQQLRRLFDLYRERAQLTEFP